MQQELQTTHSAYSSVSDYVSFLKKEKTTFHHPIGIRHFLSIPATFEDVITFLKKEGLLISGPNLTKTRNDIPPLPFYTCTWKEKIYSNGVDSDPKIAIIKSLAEGLERLITFKQGFSLNKVFFNVKKGEIIINPFEKKSYFNGQISLYPTLGIGNSDKVSYTRFYNILTKKHILVPLQYVFWGDSNQFSQLNSSTTNGGGAHMMQDKALLSAIHEYLERDAFLLHWLCKITPKRVTLQSVKKYESIELLKRSLAMGLDIQILVLDSDVGIPTFISCIFDERTSPAIFAVAGATDSFDYENAIYRALTESLTILQESLDNQSTIITFTKNNPPFIDKKIGRKEDREVE